MKPSISKIILNDFPSLFSLLSLVILWLPAVLVGLPLAFHLMISFMPAAVLIWRVLRINEFFKSGMLAEGCVERLQFVKDRARLEYSYRVGDQKFNDWCPVHRTKRTKGLRPGMPVAVLHDPHHPERSIIRDLFEAKR
ncbi:MAG: hypothetical protein SFY80_11905 [Verrucomicrobiota bacterium]|nr:hypothetical protein [Verrucomicrobiota bacterium]